MNGKCFDLFVMHTLTFCTALDLDNAAHVGGVLHGKPLQFMERNDMLFWYSSSHLLIWMLKTGLMEIMIEGGFDFGFGFCHLDLGS